MPLWFRQNSFFFLLSRCGLYLQDASTYRLEIFRTCQMRQPLLPYRFWCTSRVRIFSHSTVFNSFQAVFHGFRHFFLLIQQFFYFRRYLENRGSWRETDVNLGLDTLGLYAYGVFLENFTLAPIILAESPIFYFHWYRENRGWYSETDVNLGLHTLGL